MQIHIWYSEMIEKIYIYNIIFKEKYLYIYIMIFELGYE